MTAADRAAGAAELRELRVVYGATGIMVAPHHCRMPADCARYLAQLLDPEPVEVFGAILLDSRHRILSWAVLARGGLDAVAIDPRVVFRTALLGGAAAIIVAHNHPSGDPSASAEDVALTRRLTAAGELLDLPILDHIITAAGRYYSFKEAGQL